MRSNRIALALIGINLIGAIELPAQLVRVPGDPLVTSMASPTALEAANHRVRAASTFDLLPLEAGREWVYDYYRKNKTGSAGQWQYFTDSGRVSYVVTGSMQASDTTNTWSIQETIHLLHYEWKEGISPQRDTAYRIDSIVDVSLVEHVTGSHKVECSGRVWSFRTWDHGIKDGKPYDTAAVYRFSTDSLLELWQSDFNVQSQRLHFSAYLGLFKREYHLSAGVYWSDDILATLVGSVDPTSAPDTDVQPAMYVLGQNYPNPFNPGTTFRYELPKPSVVKLTIFDMLGRMISILVNERREAGVHEVRFDASGLTSGVYLYRLQAGNFVQTRTMLLLK